MREGGNGDESEIGCAISEALGALRGHHALDVITAGEWHRVGRMVEIPHQRCRIEEADGGNAKTAHSIEYRRTSRRDDDAGEASYPIRRIVAVRLHP